MSSCLPKSLWVSLINNHCQTHAIEINEQVKIAEFDHLQQSVDLLKAIHDEIRNQPLFIDKQANLSKEIRDPNAFRVESNVDKPLLPGTSIFEVDQGHFMKLIAKRVK